MAATKTFHLVALLLAACLMASPALASRHLTQDPTVTPGTSPVPAEGAALPGAGDLTSMNSTAGGNETSIEQCMMLLESYNITLVNATTNETLVSGWLLARVQLRLIRNSSERGGCLCSCMCAASGLQCARVP
jgi:hypothetical protein